MAYLGLATALLAAAVAAAPAAAAETPAVSAKKFVDRLYSNVGPAVPEAQTYTPELAKLIARAEAVAQRTEDPDLVGNILCDCQNLEELRARSSVVSATPAAASVRVSLTGGADEPARFLLKLVHGPSGWRLADAIAEPGGSYAVTLRRSLAGQ